MRFLWLLVPLSFALMRLVTRRYVFSALVSLACAVIVLFSGVKAGGQLLALGLLLSVAGDYLLAHQRGRSNRFLLGVAFFGLAHVAFILDAARRWTFRPLAAGLIAVLAALYTVYLTRSVLPGQPASMKGALAGYALVSLLGLFFALSLDAPPPERVPYALGIACILFSDTMIGEANFAGHARAKALILPTYYLCHILIAASRLSA